MSWGFDFLFLLVLKVSFCICKYKTARFSLKKMLHFNSNLENIHVTNERLSLS